MREKRDRKFRWKEELEGSEKRDRKFRGRKNKKGEKRG